MLQKETERERSRRCRRAISRDLFLSSAADALNSLDFRAHSAGESLLIIIIGKRALLYGNAEIFLGVRGANVKRILES